MVVDAHVSLEHLVDLLGVKVVQCGCHRLSEGVAMRCFMLINKKKKNLVETRNVDSSFFSGEGRP